MSEVVVSSSSNNVGKAIDEYHDSSYSGSSGNNSSCGNTMDEEYTSGVLGVPLKVLQEHLRTRAAFEAGTSMSIPSSTPLDKVETMYSCVVGIPSKTDKRRLTTLRSWYQILDDLNPRLAVHGKWCCEPHFGIGTYEAYLLGGSQITFKCFCQRVTH